MADLEKTTETMKRIATLNFETANYEEIIDLMKKGITLISQIKAQWSELIRFFDAVATRTKFIVNGHLKAFIRYAGLQQGNK